MKIKLKTAPVKYPISLKEAKNHLRVGLDWTDDDEHIDTLISTATKSVEHFLHRRLITQTWYYYLMEWPDKSNIVLPFGKLQSVTSIKYKDDTGAELTWDSGEYIVDIDSDPGEVVLGYDEVYPTVTLYPSNPITIEFVCGYGTAGSDVESAIQHAIKLTISDLYENRETVVITGNVQLIELPTIKNLLTPFKIFEF